MLELPKMKTWQCPKCQALIQSMLTPTWCPCCNFSGPEWIEVQQLTDVHLDQVLRRQESDYDSTKDPHTYSKKLRQAHEECKLLVAEIQNLREELTSIQVWEE